MTLLTIDLPAFHEGQQVVDASRARFKVLACGRRWGKTRYGTHKCLRVALAGGRAWWVAPSYKGAAVGWRGVKGLARQIPGAEKSETQRLVTMPGGGSVQVRSADEPDSLRGEGLDLVIIDEAAFVQEEAWTGALRPALSDRIGSAVFISTPRGRNWFFHLWNRGQSGDDPDWHSWRFPTSSNPFISPDEIEAARQELPEDVFAQEYLAEFLEGSGAVFRNIIACLTAPACNPDDHAGHRTVMGADWGKQADFTALSVGCVDCRQEVALDRFNQIDYIFQRGRLEALAQEWRVQAIVAEANAMGEPVIEELQRSGLPVAGFMTTATSKPPLIENMALASERGEWAWLPDRVARAELEAYTRIVSPTTGRSSYSAPSGQHDDTVMARALMLRAAMRPTRLVDFVIDEVTFPEEERFGW